VYQTLQQRRTKMKSITKLFLIVALAAGSALAGDGHTGTGGFADDGHTGTGGFTCEGHTGTGGKTCDGHTGTGGLTDGICEGHTGTGGRIYFCDGSCEGFFGSIEEYVKSWF
jgi:hypothetical protein